MFRILYLLNMTYLSSLSIDLNVLVCYITLDFVTDLYSCHCKSGQLLVHASRLAVSFN